VSASRDSRSVDPPARRGLVYEVYLHLASSRFATWLATKAIWSAIVWKVDPYRMRWTKVGLGTGLPLPTALLQTRGARTGQVRRNGVIYFHDGDRVTMIASPAGRPGNPCWFYNAVANPEVELGGHPFRAELVEDEAERKRLWEPADRILPASATYRRSAGRAGRTIPILQQVARDRSAGQDSLTGA
jgi:deazaflavin-dependent oxidoreductase (nitroreductase family)